MRLRILYLAYIMDARVAMDATNSKAKESKEKERKRQYKKKTFAGRSGRPSKVKRMQEKFSKNETKLKTITSRLSAIKQSESKAINRVKIMERYACTELAHIFN